MILSIIIPVYNVERYIEGTLNSIYSQGADGHLFEVIVVDDGTPDNSMVIVERYAKWHSNMSIIHQTNQGLSCARNSGLRVAKGDYIWFVDSDDQLTKDAIKNVIRSIEETHADIIGFDMITRREDTGDEAIQKVILFPKYHYMYNKHYNCYDILYKTHTAAVQRFVFKHSFLEENNLNFYPGILHEDVEFMAKAYFLAKRIVFKTIVPYRYLLRTSGSIMATLNMRSVYSKRKIIELISEFEKNNCTNIRQRAYLDARLLGLAFGLLNYHENSAEYVNFIKEQTPLLRKLAWKGILANVYTGSMIKIAKGLAVLVNPLWYKKIMDKYVNKKHK